MFEWIVDTIAETGYLGIVMLMFLENLFPPIPSELIMPLACFNAARGHLNGVGVVAAGVLGSLLGAVPWYYLGRRLGKERLSRGVERWGRWLTVSSEDIEGAAAVRSARRKGRAPGTSRSGCTDFYFSARRYCTDACAAVRSIFGDRDARLDECARLGRLRPGESIRPGRAVRQSCIEGCHCLIIAVYLYRLITIKGGRSRRS